MMASTTQEQPTKPKNFQQNHNDLLTMLSLLCAKVGDTEQAQKLGELTQSIAADLQTVETSLHGFEEGSTSVHKSVHHLLERGGKRLRPLCVVLATRMGQGFNSNARELATAVELVHNATLLHDDVVDIGEVRRNAPTARMIYGNAASIFGGDWLLVEALTKIRAVDSSDLLERALDVLREMLRAEALQLVNRGRVDASVSDYFRIVEGKTASLFGWALYAGADAGKLDRNTCKTLESFGRKLGVAFQIIDDILDVSGSTAVLGKSVLTDLREGKMTYPLLLAIQKKPSLATLLEQSYAEGELSLTPALYQEINALIQNSGAIAEAKNLASQLSAEAIAYLKLAPYSIAREMLEMVTVAILNRQH